MNSTIKGHKFQEKIANLKLLALVKNFELNDQIRLCEVANPFLFTFAVTKENMFQS